MFSKKLIDLQKQRALKKQSEFNFFHNEATEIINDHLELMGKDFSSYEVLGYDLPELNTVKLGAHISVKPEIIISNMELHYQDKPLEYLKKVHENLAQNGVLIGVFLGGYTLTELRQCFIETESKLLGGISPRVIPMIDIKDAARLIQNSGFSNPMSDIFTLELRYSSLKKLMHELRYSGISNPMEGRSSKNLGKKFFAELEEYYKSHFADAEQNLIGTFEFITITGFKS